MRLAVTLIVVLAWVTAACGNGAGDAPPAGGPATIEMVAFGDPTETAGYSTMLEAFEAGNADVAVTFSPVATQDELLARLTTSFAGGAPPDVFLINYRKFGQFAQQGVLAPVQPFLDASEALSEDEFYEPALDAFRFDGETLTCMPQNISSLEVYYNIDLFEAAGLEAPGAGWTWEDFLAAAEALTDPDADTWGVGTEASIIRLAPFVWSNGGELVDDLDQPTTLTVDRGAAREALDFFLDLSLVHEVVPPDDAEQSLDSESRFISGQLGMYLNSRKSVPALREIDGFTWDVAPLPVAPGGEPATILHGDAYCLSAAGDPELAWRLVEFAMSEAGQTIVAESGRTVPSRKDVASSQAFLRPDAPPPSSEVFLDVIPSIRATPNTASWAQVEKEADRILEDVFYGRRSRAAGITALIEQPQPLFGPPPHG